MKRTIVVTRPSYLKLKNSQLVMQRETETGSIPIEDIGYLILEHPQVTLTHSVLNAITQNNGVVISCNEKHLPINILHSTVGNSERNKRVRAQLSASKPLSKMLWQQTVRAKILNQAQHLEARGVANRNMHRWIKQVKSGDSDNGEAKAAAYYWKNLFAAEFKRDHKGGYRNMLLNYGYAILRAICARALVSSGLNLTIGIFHANKYNPYCLVDDIMEPYRPYVDSLVYNIEASEDEALELSRADKVSLLRLQSMDVSIDGNIRPLDVAMDATASSVVAAFLGEKKQLNYPVYG